MLSRRDRRGGAVLRWKLINSRYSHARVVHALMKPLLTDKFGIMFLIWSSEAS
jgi:hypothetical protein